MTDLPAVLTLDETARFLRCSRATASNLARGRIKGVKPLPVVRLGRRVLVRRDALLDWLSVQNQGSVVR
jgi:excisionase family DNA binding protein